MTNDFRLLKPYTDRMPEECGVVGIYNAGDLPIPGSMYYALHSVQHRGEESCGMAIAGEQGGIRYHKDMGLVTDVMTEEALENIGNGRVAIGHVRYSTQAENLAINAQPLVVRSRKGQLALAHNGNLINAVTLRRELEEDGTIFQTAVDSEVMANLIARSTKGALAEAIPEMMARVRGSYALVAMNEKQLVGVRDPFGIRPLCLGRKGNSYILASESCAIEVLGGEYIRDIRPGEIIMIDDGGIHSIQTKAADKSALCVFEFVYFARTDSTMDGIGVYNARYEAGRLLAQIAPVEADLVVGVPDSALPAAMGYAKASGIPYGDGLVKNRYIGRTFIQPEQSMREQGVRMKLAALRRNVHGKRIVLVDDSIVRGTTSLQIVEMLRMAGARQVHMRISSPPVVSPCYFGIDTPDKDQLIGANHSVEEIAKMIGVDSLAYLDIDGLQRTVEYGNCGFCLGCFTGEYPMDVKETCECVCKSKK